MPETSPRLAVPMIVLIVLVAAASRFLPGLPPNFSPVGAMGVYAGWMLPLPWAVALAMSGLFLSDLVLGLYHPVSMLFVYLGLAINVILGCLLYSRDNAPVRIFTSAFAGATAFYLLSNLGVWLSGEIYPKNLQGLLDCYIQAIPFFRNSLLSQIIFSCILFGSHFKLRKISMLRKTSA